MTVPEAKIILSTYRQGTDSLDADVAEALTLAEQEPDLKHWFEQQIALHSVLRDKLRHLPVPADLKSNLLAQPRLLRPAFRPQPWLAAAAALVLLGWIGWALRPAGGDSFDHYRERVVRDAMRQYVMDITSADLQEINHYLSTNGAPSNYVLPPALQQLPVTGAGLLHWQDHPVSMVCFDRGNSNMLFLFVLDRHAVKDHPPAEPILTQISRFNAASWTTQTNTYILTGPIEPDLLKKYVSPPRHPQ